MSSRKYKVGDAVMARWPGSKLWFPASVIGAATNKYEVKFEDGSEFELDAKSVNTEVSFKKSRSPSRSPARRRRSASPGRRRRSRSPARKRSPSPSPTKPATRGRTRTVTKKEVVVTSTPKSTVTKSVTNEVTRTYVTRSAAKKGEATLALSVDVKTGRVPKTKDLSFGGSIGCSIAILLHPVLIVYLYLACTAKSCSLLTKPALGKLEDYFDRQATLQYLGLLLFLAVLSVLPVGKVFEGPAMRNGQRMQYRKNGLCLLLICLSALGAGVWYKVPLVTAYDNCLRYLSVSIVVSTLLGIVLYVKSRRAAGNALAPQGNSGKVIYDFFTGHELHPRLFQAFDFKMYVYRVGIISMVLMTLLNVGKMCADNEKPSTAILLAAGLQCWYGLDSLWHEDRVVYTSFFQEFGCGFYLAFRCFTMLPFGLTYATRFLVNYSPELSNWKIAAILATQLIAACVYRLSNSQKWEFRLNPYNPKLAHLQSIATSAETRLLVSGWWGWVRHPNYLGDILLSVAWSMPCGCSHFLPWLLTILGVFNVIVRERRDFNKCMKKYGAAWARYCQQVKYRLIPYVY